MIFFLMIRRPPRSTRTDTLLPYTTLCRSTPYPSRLVTVQFDTSVNSRLPWRFSADTFEMKVHPGELAEATFHAANLSDSAIVGQAVPSIAPSSASAFFSKRSEERRVGKEGVSKCRSRWSPSH